MSLNAVLRQFLGVHDRGDRQVHRGTLAYRRCMTAVAAAANTGALRSSMSTGSPRPIVIHPARSSRRKGCHVCCLRELLLVPPLQPLCCTMCCQTFLPEMSPRHAGAGDVLDLQASLPFWSTLAPNAHKVDDGLQHLLANPHAHMYAAYSTAFSLHLSHCAYRSGATQLHHSRTRD